jgi:hypothetical protein
VQVCNRYVIDGVGVILTRMLSERRLLIINCCMVVGFVGGDEAGLN